ncbi:MAG: Bor family protein [Alteromonadaceae bacterium]|nr:MAG: Bor family protein [Alteromonadaceae bacterium]
MKQLLLLLLILGLSACSSVSVRTDGQAKSIDPPNFEQRYTYWFWGFRGRHAVNVREVCQDKKMAQIQALHTLSDTFFSLITVGIYAPRTARIWCKKDGNQ